MTHLPFANWCKECVEAKAVEDPHWTTAPIARGAELVDEHPHVQMDYSYLDRLTVLSLYYVEKMAGNATIVEQKGVQQDFPAAWVKRQIAAMGLTDIILHVDPENAIKALAE